MPEVDIYNFKGEKAGKVDLSARLFGQEVNAALLHEIVVMQLANQRLGTASTKTRGEVSGGGIKPWRQKHTGRARAGSNRSPLWRHGGTTFGPRPRSYKYDLPTKKKQLALISALSAKARDNEIIVLDKLELTQPKTKNVQQMLKKFNTEGPVLLVVTKISPELVRATRNIKLIQVGIAANIGIYDIMKSKKMLLTKDALAALETRIKEN